MARSTMAWLIQRVRDLASAYFDEYTVGDSTYWTDDQVQSALDRTRKEIIDEVIYPARQVDSGGTAVYYLYQSADRNYESTTGGTSIFYLRNASGTRYGTAAYTTDYELGRMEFAASTGGSAVYLTGRSYDPYAAAADVWNQKAAHVAVRFDFSADGSSFKASQLRAQYERMAAQMEAKATSGGGLSSGTMIRDDVAIWPTSY